MSIEGLEDFDNLMKQLDSLGEVGNKISSQAFKGALKNASNIIKAEMPKDTGVSSKQVKSFKIKRYKKSGSQWGSVGFKEDSWEKWKGAYFQQYGYQRGKTRVTKNVGWMDRAIEKARPKVESDLYEIASKEIDKILK